MTTHIENGLPIAKNGYLYIYVSNETPNIDVFFDNLQVTHIRGPLLEETHYYPFGLTMQGISSKSAGGLENKKKYNGIEQTTELDLNQYDAFFRELDPQTGRWWQIDPKIESMEMWSPYASNYDNPIRYSDPLGDEPEKENGPGPSAIKLGKTLWTILRAADKISELKKISLDDVVNALSPITINQESLKKMEDLKAEENNQKLEKGGTYVLKDDKGKIQRNGRTKDLERREKEHAKREETKDLEFEVDLRTDNKDAQRGREHQVHEKENPPLNKIKPIRDNNPRKDDYIKAAEEVARKANKT